MGSLGPNKIIFSSKAAHGRNGVIRLTHSQSAAVVPVAYTEKYAYNTHTL